MKDILPFFVTPTAAFLAFAIGLIGAFPVLFPLFQRFTEKRAAKAFRSVFEQCRKAGITLVVPTGGRCADVPLSELNIVRPAVPSNGPNTITTVEDTVAQGAVLEEMMRARIPVQISVHSATAETDCTKNLFLVCGPVGNRITRAMLRELGKSSHPLPHRFMKRRYWQIERSSLTFEKLPENDSTDFALIAKVPSPWAPKNRPATVYICAGIEGLGTLGAAIFFVTDPEAIVKNLRKLNKSEASNFSAVIKVSRRSHGLPDAQIVDFAPLP